MLNILKETWRNVDGTFLFLSNSQEFKSYEQYCFDGKNGYGTYSRIITPITQYLGYYDCLTNLFFLPSTLLYRGIDGLTEKIIYRREEVLVV